MLNFRKLKQDFSPADLKEGKRLFEHDAISAAKVVEMTAHHVRIGGSIDSGYDHTYSCEIEIDLGDSTTIDSDCNCPQHYDCHHLAAMVFYLEKYYDELVVKYSHEADLDSSPAIDEDDKETLRATIQESQSKQEQKRDERFQKELLEEYRHAARLLGQSPFFLPQEDHVYDSADLVLLYSIVDSDGDAKQKEVELQLALRPPYRTKLLLVPSIAEFLEAVRHEEPIYIGTRRFFFSMQSFEQTSALVLRWLMDFAKPVDSKSDKSLRFASMPSENFGMLLAAIYEAAVREQPYGIACDRDGDGHYVTVAALMPAGSDEPLRLSLRRAQLKFALEYLSSPAPTVLINPTLFLDDDVPVSLDKLHWFESAVPGLLHQNSYWRFENNIKRKHLRSLLTLRELAIPEQLFGTLVENSLPELSRHGQLLQGESIEQFVTIPYTDELKGDCHITYLDGELEARLTFTYGGREIPASPSQLTYEQMQSFVGAEGILARHLTEEQKILGDLFQGFVYEPHQGQYVAKSEKKIIEFMTEVIPRNQHKVTFHCPENLLEKFIYDDTTFTLELKESDRIDSFEVSLTVTGHLEGTSLDQLWECLSAKRSYLPLEKKKSSRTAKRGAPKNYKILILDLDKLSPVVQIFDEIGINELTTHKENRPLWSLAHIDPALFKGLPIKFSMSKKLKLIQEQILGQREMAASAVPAVIKAQLREYQLDGVQWLERLRTMHLNGILADDMGLGKTLQAIIAVTQLKERHKEALTLVVAPTSLLYNWKEEFAKFNPALQVLIVDGNPQQRRKLLAAIDGIDVIITSYSLLQKDIDEYQKLPFHYAILDEAQHIKNRGTRNAKSVKMLQAPHRLILTGTPLENSLDELWSLFDFLMPGLLSSYDRFVEKYIRPHKQGEGKALEMLRRKVSPFILRRMKKDVLSELPPITEVVYHCHLSDTQRELYRSYAASAREELSQLVQREGFDRVQIHVLATLTRLKQICCHPAIFAKEEREAGDSAKYDMLMELLQTLIEGRHKTVIYSQYTRMLNIMREDFLSRGISFEYLDGSSKNRLSIVKRFNEDPNISVFLVSLRAGGVGLNLTGADTVVHYDMWYNPAVESQATDRVHRMGQQQNVTSVKLITLNTIEEKILSLHKRKKGLTQTLVGSDDEAMGKLTWEEVLELLQI